MRMKDKLATIAAVLLMLLLITAWVQTNASAWAGMHDEGAVRVSGSIATVEPEAPHLALQVGAAGYDCGTDAFWMTVRNPNPEDTSLTLELWLAANDGPRTPITKLGAMDHTLPAATTGHPWVDANDPADGIYRLKVYETSAADDAQWSGAITVEDGCGGDDVTAEPTAEPTDEPTDEATDEPAAEPTDEATAEPTDEPTPEPEDTPAPEETPEPEDTPTPDPTQEEAGGTGGEAEGGE